MMNKETIPKESISRWTVFARSLPVALTTPAILWMVVAAILMVVAGEFLLKGLVGMLIYMVALAFFSALIHLAHYGAAAAFFFVVGLTPSSVFWKLQWGLPAGVVLGTLTSFISVWLFDNGADYPVEFLWITGAYGAITAFAVIRARRKLLER